jgi:5-methyltetrahydrofolate--homocysteine methyltransferase
MSNRLAELLAERDYLLADGATGTNMMAMGLAPGQAPDLWNVDRPENVTRLHESFLQVGSDIILTNTFGANRCRLKLHESQDRTREVNEAGARLARSAADATGRPVVVAGSMGPTGEMLEPHGTFTQQAAEEAFSEQAEALAEGGVDVLWIETVFAFAEVEAAVTAAAKTGLAFASTMTFDTKGRTLMGDTPERAIEFIHGLSSRPIAFGANCGVGPATLLDTLCGFARAADGDDVIIAKSNCGVPEMVDGEIVYSGDEKTMATYARMARDAGARIVGGCCGTTPKHLAAIASALEGYTPGSVPANAAIENALGPIDKPKREGEGHRKRRRRRR